MESQNIIELFKPIDGFELTPRTFSCLNNADIKTVADLVRRTESEMLRLKNFGRKNLNEIKSVLGEMELHLKNTKQRRN